MQHFFVGMPGLRVGVFVAGSPLASRDQWCDSLLDGIQRGCRRRAIFCESGKGGRQRNAVTQQREHSLPRGFRPCISLVEFRRPVGPRLPQPPAVVQFFPRGFEVFLSAALAAEKGVDSPLRASARVQCRLVAISETRDGNPRPLATVGDVEIGKLKIMQQHATVGCGEQEIAQPRLVPKREYNRAWVTETFRFTQPIGA